jgi:cell division transport system permease protein
LWVKRLYQFMELGQRLVWALATLLGLAVLLIIGNTIRLSIESRRDEILVVKLVGGTDAFVRRPFLYTGIWFGLGGGIIAWLLLSMGLYWLSGPVETLISLYGSDFVLQGLSLSDSLMLIFDGVILGWLGAWLAVSRHLTKIKP